ncbi:hypothetical protein ES703_25717 [subsurface metagenome]
MRVTKVLAIIAFIFMSLALYTIAITPPATGYELNIYKAYPLHFWVFLIGSIACGICILLRQAFRDEKSNWWLAGFLVIIFSNLIILTLPIFRGYATYGREDALSHLGFMEDILVTGHIGTRNLYPMIHILGVSLLDIVGLSKGAVAVFIPALFSTAYMLGVYLLASVISRNRGQALLVTAFVAPFLYADIQTELHPSFSSLFMLPLLLYLYHRREKSSSNKVQWTMLVLILAFHIVFHHPEAALFAVVVFLSFGLSSILYRLVTNYKKTGLPKTTWLNRDYGTLSIIMFVVFFTWYSSYSLIQGTFRATWDWLVHQIGYSTYQFYTAELAIVERSPFYIVELLFYRHGAVLLYFLVSSIAIIFIWKWSLSRKKETDATIFTYGILTMVASLSIPFFWFAYFEPMYITRGARFLIPMATILNGLVVYELVSAKSFFRFGKEKFPSMGKIIIGFTALLIIGASIVGTFNAYRSPHIHLWNEQVTRYEIEGTSWLIERQDGQTPIQSFLVKIPRFEGLHLGSEQSSTAIIDREYIPRHFGYDINESAAETFDSPGRYLVTAEIDRKFPLILREEFRDYYYTEDDFVRLSSDATVRKIYANGEFEVWRVYGE